MPRIAAILSALFVAGCGGTVTEFKTIEVKVPVLQPCPIRFIDVPRAVPGALYEMVTGLARENTALRGALADAKAQAAACGDLGG